MSRYIMFTLETPLKMRHDVDYDILNGFFNWTMTYRMDSDVYAPYGQIVPKNSE